MAEISIVMPVFNSEKFLREAIDSILKQTFTDFEFIIVNDGSTDQSLSIIQSYNDKRIRAFTIQNSGVASALNYGIHKASSEIIARMDADDISHPTRLEKQYKCLKQNPKIILLGTNARIIDENGEFVYIENIETDSDKIKKRLPASSFYHPSVVFFKKDFVKVEGYPTFMKRAQDAVLFTKLSELGELTNLIEPLIDYRITTTSLSTRSKRDKKVINQLIINALNSEEVDNKLIGKLEGIIKKTPKKIKKRSYHLFLSKKYLWNNYNQQKVQFHLGQVISAHPFYLHAYFLLFLSVIPSRIVQKVYKMAKG